MKITKILALTLATVLLCSLFAGCSLFGGKTILKIDGKSISEEIYAGAMSRTSDIFQQTYGFSIKQYLGTEIIEGKTGAQLLKEETDALLGQLEGQRIMAEQNGIELTSEEKKAIEESKKAQIDAIGGRKAFLEQLKQVGISETFYDYLLENQQISAKLYAELFTGDGKFAPGAEEVAASVEAIADDIISGGFIRVKHILVLANEGDEDLEEKKAKAEGILARAKAGEDFDALIKEVGEDPGMQTYTEGYLMDKDGITLTGTQMVTEFSEASNALAENGISDIVKSSHGFHIIKRYPLSKEYIITNAAAFTIDIAPMIYNEKLLAFIDGITVEKTSAYDKVDVYKILGIEKKLGETSQPAGTEEHYEGDGHNHDHSAETEANDDAASVTPAE